MKEGGSGIYAFVKGRPTPRPPPATGLQVLLRQLEPEGHRDPPLSVLGLFPLHLSVSQPQEADSGHPLSYSGVLSPPLSCPPEGRRSRPRASGPGLGGSVGALAGEAQLGGWTPGPHPLNHEGTERDLG